MAARDRVGPRSQDGGGVFAEVAAKVHLRDHSAIALQHGTQPNVGAAARL